MVKIKNVINNLLNTFSQAINEDLDHFKIVSIRFFGNITSQMNKAPGASVYSALKDVFINNQNSIMIIMVRNSLYE